ncbi:MAG: hypothetical protein HYY01_08680 [Chloroflexi bacterium]|nr:hypothetical protein [Chloroflexota bacterium]
MRYPQWATPERRAHLVAMWSRLGNRCLLGHLGCSEPEHFVHTRVKPEVVGVPVALKVVGKDGTVRVLNTHQPRKVYVQTAEWVGGIYYLVEDEVVQEWVSDDRAERAALLQAERRRLHDDQYRIRQGQWDNVAREQWSERHGIYYLEGMTVDALTHKRVAKVRIASSPVRLWVTMPSQNAKRKARRYGKEGARSDDEAIVQAVKHYLNS